MCIHCCDPCPDCQSCNLQNRRWLVCAYIMILLGGVACLIVGLTQVANGEETTVSKLFVTLNNNYKTVELPDMAKTTVAGTFPSPVTTYTVNVLTIPLTFIFSGTTTSLSFADTYYATTMPRPNNMNTLVVATIQVTIGTMTSTITSPSFPPLSKLGLFLNTVCFVITRKARNSIWTLSSSYDTCYYPFTKNDNVYSGAPTPTIQVIVRSEFDPFLFLQGRQAGSSMNTLTRRESAAPWTIADDAVLLYKPNTGSLLTAGIIGIVAGLLMCCVFTVWCTRVRRWQKRHSVQFSPQLAPAPEVNHTQRV